MSECGFIYFYPSDNPLMVENRFKREHPYLSEMKLAYTPTSCGLDSKAGVFFIDNRYSGKGTYIKDKQTWIKYKDYYVGIWNEEKPIPEILLRENQLSGHSVKLGDGNDWIIPIARMIDGTTGLNQTYAFDENGKLSLTMAEKEKRLFEFACEMWDNFIAKVKENEVELTLEDETNGVVELLSINYMIDKPEITLLNLLNKVVSGNVMKAALDLPTLKKLMATGIEKKNLDEQQDI